MWVLPEITASRMAFGKILIMVLLESVKDYYINGEIVSYLVPGKQLANLDSWSGRTTSDPEYRCSIIRFGNSRVSVASLFSLEYDT
ncbi:MAG: hypothetical protein V8R52_07465 [Coprobacter fastidiosus]